MTLFKVERLLLGDFGLIGPATDENQVPIATLTRFSRQFCGLVSISNEYEGWATQIPHKAIIAPNHCFSPLTVEWPVPHGDLQSPAQIRLSEALYGDLEGSILNTGGKHKHVKSNTNPKRNRVRHQKLGNTRALALCRLSLRESGFFALLSRSKRRHSSAAALACFILSIVFLICFASPGFAQNTETQWATDKVFQQSRHRAFSISWQAAPLRDRIGQLARQQGISVFLDRRVDPRTPINLTASNVTMEQLLLQLCEQQELGFCRLGDSFYVGPKLAAQRLMIGSTSSTKAGRKTSTALLKKSASDWPDLTTPKEALNALVAEAGLELENADLLPHDLMPSGNMPPMTLDRRLRLLLIQFDLDYELNRNARTLVLKRASDLPTTGSVRFSDVDLSLAEYQEIKAKAGGSRMRRNKNSVTVTGPVEELVMVRDFIVKSFKPAEPADGDQQFTLKVTSRRSAILAAIGKQLHMPVDTSLADPDTMAEVVSLSVANASLQELLDQIVADSGATCVVSDGKIVVSRRK